MKKKKIAVSLAFSALSVVLILSLGINLFLVREVYRERERVKNAVMPLVSEDYFTRSVIAAQYEAGYYRDELEEYGDAAFAKRVPVQQVDVKRLSQLPDYPNGCESACAVMMLQYYGIDISLSEFIDRYLPRQSVFEKGGRRYGPDPSRFYAGNPQSEKGGWGCFPPAIQKGLTDAFADRGLGKCDSNTVLLKKDGGLYRYFIVDCSGAELFRYEELPMIIWVTQDYEPVSEMYEWQQFGGNKTFTYPKKSHTVVVTGYDEEFYYINDPLRAEDTVKVEKEKLEECFMSAGCLAVSVYGGELTDDEEINAYLNAASRWQKYGDEDED